MLLLEDRITKAVKGINYVPSDFGSDENEDDYYYYDVVRQIRETGVFSNTYGEDEYFCGASKLVFDVRSDKVIKLPFTGYHYYADGEYDDETGFYEDEEVFEEFRGANNSINNWDYCLTEVEKYALAENAGFEKFFAKTELFCRVDGHPIYLQDKVIVYAEGGYQSFPPSEQSKQYCEKHFSYENKSFKGAKTLPNDWVAKAVDLYGAEEVENFLVFLEKERFSDLHYHNIGYTRDGRPVILDYSGYHE